MTWKRHIWEKSFFFSQTKALFNHAVKLHDYGDEARQNGRRHLAMRPGFIQKTQQPLQRSLTTSSLTPPCRLGRVEVLVFSFVTIGNTQPTLPYAKITHWNLRYCPLHSELRSSCSPRFLLLKRTESYPCSALSELWGFTLSVPPLLDGRNSSLLGSVTASKGIRSQSRDYISG